jgi:NADPH-dependent curcumin reductase CurA
MSDVNHQVRLATRPHGMLTPEVWELTEEQVPAPAAGQVLVEVQMISLDPAMRGWLNDVPSYVPPVGIGEVMRAGGVGRVVSSADGRFGEGDWVSAVTGVQEYALLDGDALTPIDTALAAPETYLGALGISGMTAYFGLLDVGRPQAGETVVVSGAAGSVGSLVGQIARIHGCRSVGIAGGPEKCAWLTGELGFDAAIDYRAEEVRGALRPAAPEGIDVFFDNVGGEILDAALTRMARGGRIVICGAISQYNATAAVAGPSNYLSLLVKRATMAGFVVFDYAGRYREAAGEIAGWLADGSLIAREEVLDGGVEAFGATLMRLFNGENTGKLVLRMAAGQAG